MQLISLWFGLVTSLVQQLKTGQCEAKGILSNLLSFQSIILQFYIIAMSFNNTTNLTSTSTTIITTAANALLNVSSTLLSSTQNSTEPTTVVLTQSTVTPSELTEDEKSSQRLFATVVIASYFTLVFLIFAYVILEIRLVLLKNTFQYSVHCLTA